MEAASETFLNLVDSELCHGQDAAVLERSGRRPSIRCTACRNTPIPDVYEYICSGRHGEPLDSCRLAQAYHEWTNDEETPVSFTFIGGGEGILSTRIERQLLSRLRHAVLVLEAVNAPFLKPTTTSEGSPPTASGDSENARKCTKEFASSYKTAIDETYEICKRTVPLERQIVYEQITKHMPALMESSDSPDMFAYFFEKLVPFVKRCKSDDEGTTVASAAKSPKNLAHRLVLRMEESRKIRDAYSRFSVPFDVMYVMLGCYVANVDVDAVSNWVFDLMNRICVGYFFWKKSTECVFVKSLRAFVKTQFDRRRNTKFYYVLREIYKGNASESLSSFLPQYAKIDRLVRDRFRVAGESESTVQVAVTHYFPSVLFENPAEQYAFVISLSYVAENVDAKTGLVAKGTHGKARAIYGTLKKFFRGVEKFNEIENCWTKDTLDQFFVYESELQSEIVALAKLVVSERQPQDDDGDDVDVEEEEQEQEDKPKESKVDTFLTARKRKGGAVAYDETVQDGKITGERLRAVVGGGCLRERDDTDDDNVEEMDVEQ